MSERRRFTRYRVKDNIFAALNDPNVIVGQVKDLSMGGAAFEFIPDTSGEAQQTGQHILDIFMLGNAEKLLSMPCTVFLRKSARQQPNIFFPMVISQICVAEFMDLPLEQSRDLLYFLIHHSVGYAV